MKKTEIIQGLVSFLDLLDVVKCMRLNRQWQQLCRHVIVRTPAHTTLTYTQHTTPPPPHTHSHTHLTHTIATRVSLHLLLCSGESVWKGLALQEMEKWQEGERQAHQQAQQQAAEHLRRINPGVAVEYEGKAFQR